MRGGWVGWTLLAALVLAYPVSCLMYPQRDCRWCKGRGVRRPESDPTLSRKCWWCKGSPRRDRFATRLWKRRRRRAARSKLS
ncbi:hypothetical protein [Micromonospora sp. DT47]|uniref:hypothetical protein n=1 Tax=Micromonospora sp. DT47 TaxID=3393431 RepID=UPI003CF0A021